MTTLGGFNATEAKVIATEPEPTSTHHSHTGAIVGSVVGGVVGLLLIVTAFTLWIRHRRHVRARRATQAGTDYAQIASPALPHTPMGQTQPTSVPATGNGTGMGMGMGTDAGTGMSQVVSPAHPTVPFLPYNPDLPETFPPPVATTAYTPTPWVSTTPSPYHETGYHGAPEV